MLEESKNKFNLEYKPNINFEEDYYSEQSYSQDTSINISTTIPVNPDKEIEDLIDKIETSIAGLPDYIQIIIKNVFDPVKDFFEENKDTSDKDKTEEEDKDTSDKDDDFDDEWENEEDDKDTDEDDGNEPDVGFDDEEDDMFEPLVHIVDNELSTTQKIQNNYKENLHDLFVTYLEKINDSVNNFWVAAMALLYGKPFSTKQFILNDIPIDYKVDAINQHLLDFAIRSQIVKYEKVSFCNKNFSLDETIVKLRSFKSSHELMLRYAKTNNKDKYTREGYDYNTILEASMITYSRKHNDSVLSLYKYLNSSTVTASNALSSYLQEMKAKQYIK